MFECLRAQYMTTGHRLMVYWSFRPGTEEICWINNNIPLVCVCCVCASNPDLHEYYRLQNQNKIIDERCMYVQSISVMWCAITACIAMPKMHFGIDSLPAFVILGAEINVLAFIRFYGPYDFQ